VTGPVFDTTVWPKLTQLADCLCQEVITSGLGPLCFCGILPGALVPADYVGACKENGMAWVRLTGAVPTINFPNPNITEELACGNYLAVGIEIGILRASSVPDNDGTLPNEATLLSEAEWQVADMMAMRRALACCFGRKGWILGSYAPTGPQGAVYGGTWSATITDQP
jgi:hypothetical protein